jgi:16S rRNA (cytosine1402-N4)-methyltransferase
MRNSAFAAGADNGSGRGRTRHVPVLVEELMSAIQPRDGGLYADCTFGRGGHALELLRRGGENTRVIALDRDREAVRVGLDLARHDARLSVVHAPFSSLARVAKTCDRQLDAVIFDLGVSSPQIDSADRGFSFRFDGPLDMRMDTGAGESAAEWLAHATQAEIATVLHEYGEERFARRIARALVVARAREAITGTAQLAALVAAAVPARSRRADPGQHPATRSFQAIRIHINQELRELAAGLEQALECLRTGGRLAVVSFHSLEDRQVKRFMRAHARPPLPSRHEPVPHEVAQPRLRLCGKAVRPSDEERARNPRARSAVLRVAEKQA